MREAMHSEKKFPAQNFNNISTDPYINHSVIAARGTNKNSAGALHLDALLDHDSLVRPRNSMLDHPCGAATGCRTGRGIFAVIEKHASMNARRGVNSLPRDTEKKFPASALEILRGALLVDLQAARRLQRTQWNHGERSPGRNGLDRSILGNIFCRDAADFGKFFAIVNHAELRIALGHLAEDRFASAFFELHRNGSNIEVELNLTCARVSAEEKRSADRRMSGKRKFLLHREDAHTNAALALRGFVSGKDKSRLREVHLASNGLHLGIAQASGVVHDGEGIAFQWLGSEDIKLCKRELACLACHADWIGETGTKVQEFTGAREIKIFTTEGTELTEENREEDQEQRGQRPPLPSSTFPLWRSSACLCVLCGKGFGFVRRELVAGLTSNSALRILSACELSACRAAVVVLARRCVGKQKVSDPPGAIRVGFVFCPQQSQRVSRHSKEEKS